MSQKHMPAMFISSTKTSQKSSKRPSKKTSRCVLAPSILFGVLVAGAPLTSFAQDSADAPQAVPLVPSDASGTSATAPASAEPSAARDDEKPDPTRNIEAGLEGDTKTHIAVGPEGKTLPARVVRVRVPFRFASGDSGYDADGKKTSPGVELNAVGMGVVLEYGVSDDFSLQVLAPIILSNSLGMNATQFRQSAPYKANYEKFITTAGNLLESRGICPSAAACAALINSGYALPYGTQLTLPTGEALEVKAGQPVKDVADALVLGGARPEKGTTGLGDVEIGGLYAVLNERGPFTGSPIFLSLGGGFRLPTGSFKDVPTSQRATGRGTFDLGLRSNLDYTPLRGLFLSWQNQAEFMLAKGKKKRSSVLDSGQLNEADPTTPLAVASGSDGKGNELDFERKGVRNVGYLKAALALGILSDAVESLSVNGQFKYDYDAKEYLGGVSQGEARRYYGLLAGVSWDGLAYRLPLQFDVEYEVPVGGENLALTAKVLSTTLKGYYRF